MSRNIIAICAACLILCAAVCATVSAQASDCPSDRIISTSATGEMKVNPDRAQVSVSVQTENADVKVAQGENARVMDQVNQALIAAGIPKDDLKTTGYYIYPVYDDSQGIFGQKVKYYRVTNTLQITLKDVGRTGEVIDIAVANGANQVDSIVFLLSEEKEQSIRAEVLTKAVNRARSDADAVAAAMGLTITGVKEVSVGSSYPPVLYDNSRTAGAAEMKAAVPTPIEPGQLTVTAQVSVIYLIN